MNFTSPVYVPNPVYENSLWIWRDFNAPINDLPQDGGGGGGGRQSTGIWHPERPQDGKFDSAAILERTYEWALSGPPS